MVCQRSEDTFLCQRRSAIGEENHNASVEFQNAARATRECTANKLLTHATFARIIHSSGDEKFYDERIVTHAQSRDDQPSILMLKCQLLLESVQCINTHYPHDAGTDSRVIDGKIASYSELVVTRVGGHTQ